MVSIGDRVGDMVGNDTADLAFGFFHETRMVVSLFVEGFGASRSGGARFEW